ncbi:LysR family transcriptional regulator [Oceanobacillus saliphilus]|uniref:LysR family transcriptional regulator n=1 Tax=Oceanobacillus saliphilus TaxID=2925834 RepID=UPI00201DA75D|nr:LysR family transcriptional regulator [Oceanobacillus saliphilus]
MDQTDWEIINLLFEEQNITKTAERMYISQPALTYRIKSIEKKLGVKIIHRTKQRIKFTLEGEYVAEYAQNMVEQYQSLKDKLENSNDDNKGTIRIGVSTNFARFILPQILNAFLELYPEVQFHVTTSWSESILEMAEKGNIHLAIVRGDFLWEHEKVLLKREPISVISKKPIDIKRLSDEPRIMFHTDPDLQQTIDHWWQENFVKAPKVAMMIDNIETCTKMVESGLGYAIVPEISLTDHDGLEKMPLRDKNNEKILRDTWLLYHDTDAEYPIIKKFIDFISEISGV